MVTFHYLQASPLPQITTQTVCLLLSYLFMTKSVIIPIVFDNKKVFASQSIYIVYEFIEARLVIIYQPFANLRQTVFPLPESLLRFIWKTEKASIFD